MYCVLRTTRFATYYLLHTTYYTLLTTHSVLRTAYYLLLTAHSSLRTAYYILHTTHYALRIAYCVLLTTHCILRSGSSEEASTDFEVAAAANAKLEAAEAMPSATDPRVEEAPEGYVTRAVDIQLHRFTLQLMRSLTEVECT